MIIDGGTRTATIEIIKASETIGFAPWGCVKGRELLEGEIDGNNIKVCIFF